MFRPTFNTSGQWLQVTVTVLIAAVLTALMSVGFHRANQLQSASSALQGVAGLSAQPALLLSDLTLLQRSLESRTYAGDTLRDIAARREQNRHTISQLEADLARAGLTQSAELAGPLQQALTGWSQVDSELSPIVRAAHEQLYTDTAGGSGLSGHGMQVKKAVDSILVTEAATVRDTGDQLHDTAARLRRIVAGEGHSLRTMLLAGTTVSALLMLLVLYYAVRSRRSAAAAATAQRQVTDILGTVREGLFLVGQDLRLGSTCSESLTTLLRRPAPTGRSFEELLSPLTDEKTVAAGLKFLSLLWKNKVNDELIESINPLSQVEVRFQDGKGGSEVRFLSFSFRRVRGVEAGSAQVLGVVSDVTDRVLLARELDTTRSDNDSQTNLLLQLLRIDPLQLDACLSNANVSFQMANSMLKSPEQGQAELRKKLDGVFREIHSVKGEAAALGLTTIVERAHAIEDLLASLRQKTTLTGNDFVPVVVRLNELMTLAATIRAMQERLTPFQSRTGSATQAPTGPGAALEALLSKLATETAQASGREVRLEAQGLSAIPAPEAATIKDICVHMVRNAVVHGIEPGPERLGRGKSATGVLRIIYSDQGTGGRTLSFEDDGRGLDYEAIIDRALRRGLVRPDDAAALDRATACRLIFQPGFTTATEVTEHAGRGVGLDAVNALTRRIGGRIGLATAPGRYTRFSLQLPALTAPAAATGSGG